MTKRKTLVAAGVVMVGVTIAVLVFRDGRASGSAEAPARVAETKEARPLELAPAARARNPVKVAPAQLAKVSGDIQVVGTVTFHEDHFAVVGPLVTGRISKLVAGVGDQVKRGQVIAEIESSEVGQARAEFVSAQARYGAADTNLKRESDLAEKKISSSRERELAHAQWVTEQAGVRAAVMRLRAIGLTAGGRRGGHAPRPRGQGADPGADLGHRHRAPGYPRGGGGARDRRVQDRRHLARLGDPGPL